MEVRSTSSKTSGGFTGGSGVRLKPPLEANSFNFMGKVMEIKRNVGNKPPFV